MLYFDLLPLELISIILRKGNFNFLARDALSKVINYDIYKLLTFIITPKLIKYSHIPNINWRNIYNKINESAYIDENTNLIDILYKGYIHEELVKLYFSMPDFDADEKKIFYVFRNSPSYIREYILTQKLTNNIMKKLIFNLLASHGSTTVYMILEYYTPTEDFYKSFIDDEVYLDTSYETINSLFDISKIKYGFTNIGIDQNMLISIKNTSKY